MSLDRRQFLLRSSAGLALVAGVGSALPAWAQTYDVESLLASGPLPEKTLGSPDAPVTVIEYASMTCGHCATFHADGYKHLKSEYIDTGKVLFVFREYPLDPVAAAAFMLARCAPEDKYFDVIDFMFAEQANWAFTSNPREALLNFARQIGFSQENFERCLTNQQLLDGINASRDRAATQFAVTSTPTFFFNGVKKIGALRPDDVDAAIAEHL